MSAAPAGTLEVFDRIRSDCLLVDGVRVSNADVALAIVSAYTTQTREQVPGSRTPIPPITSDGWLRYGAAHAIAGRLLQLATAGDKPAVSSSQVAAAVSNCRQAAAQMRVDSSCSADLLRQELQNKAEIQEITQRGQTVLGWLQDQLSHHTIVIRGYDLTVSQISQALVPPGCRLTPACEQEAQQQLVQ